MDRSGASCFVYAKASGMLSKSFTGSRAHELFKVKTLKELWALLFVEEVPAVPYEILAQTIEKKATKKFIDEFIKLLKYYSKPNDILVELLRSFDLENLKDAIGLLATGKDEDCHFYSIFPYNVINYNEWPNLEKMTANTFVSWCNQIPTVEKQQELSNKIDIQFILKLWQATNQLPIEERKLVQNVIINRYSMKNVIWAMRLKVYYNMSEQEIKDHLLFLDDNKSSNDLFASEALKILNYKVDSYEQWANWKYSELINSNDVSLGWKLDPQVVETKFAKKFYQSMKKDFHKYPFTSMVLVTWFYIKLTELDYIRTATEAIRLNVDEEQLQQIVDSL